MTVRNIKSYIRYTGDAVQCTFPIPFSFHAENDIHVYTRKENGDKRLLRIGIDYKIEGEHSNTTCIMQEVLALGESITILRKQEIVQELALHSGANIDPTLLEYTFDSLVLMMQEIEDRIEREQEEGDMPTGKELRKLYGFMSSAVKNITDMNITMEEKIVMIEKIYEAIQGIYEDIKNIVANSGGGGGDITGHENNRNAHQFALVPVGCVAYFVTAKAPRGWLILEKKVYEKKNYPNLAEILFCGNEENETAEFGYYCTDAKNPEESRDVNGEYFMLGPDVRGEFIRNYDAERGIDTGRKLGTLQTMSTIEQKAPLFSFGIGAGSGPIKVYNKTRGEEDFLHVEGDKEVRPQNIALLACIKY